MGRLRPRMCVGGSRPKPKRLCSHTPTVVRVECEGDDASRWGNRKFDPLPRPNRLTDHHQKLHTWLGPGYLPTKCSHDPSVSFPICAKLRMKDVYSAFFGGGSSNAPQTPGRTDFHAWYVKPAQGCAFSGLENKTLTLPPRNSLKTAILSPLMTGLGKFSVKNRFTMGVEPYVNSP